MSPSDKSAATRGAGRVRFAMAVLAALAPFGLTACQEPQGAEISRNVQGQVELAEIPVETLVVRPRAFEDTYVAVGVIEPEDTVTLGAEIPGRIIKMPNDIGVEVKKGQVLIELDGSAAMTQIRRLEANISRIESALSLANKDLAREEELFKAKVGAAKAHDAAKMAVESHQNELAAAKAELEASRISMEKLKIVSPIDAMIAEKYASEGEYVNPGQQLYKLVTADRVEFVCSLSERDVTRVKPGDPIEVSVDALDGQIFTGAVKSVDPAGNQQTRTFRVWVTIENPHPHPLKPAMSARAKIVRGKYENVFLLPEEAILREGSANYVFVERDGKAARADVTIARAAGATAVVSEGLSAEQNVVILGQYAIAPDDPLRIRRAHDQIPEYQFN